jgi:pilus assembly protein FimV
MPRFLAALCFFLIGVLPGSVVALGLGEIDLKSALNQPFLGEIPISSESSSDLTDLDVELASAGTFEEFGLDRAQFLSNFKFVVLQQGPDAVIRITSADPVVEPFVTLLLEITWAQGRLLREYTVLLDPPAFADQVAAPTVAAPVAGPSPSQSPVARSPSPAPEPAPVSAAPSSSVAAPPVAAPAFKPVEGGNFGPVQRNDTLWAIAGRYTDGTTVNRNQMMLAIYRANPEAFVGNINRLKAGMILRVPDAAEVERLGRSEANSEVQRQNSEWRGGADESPRLRLVPPPEPGEVSETPPRIAADGASADATGEAAEMQGRIDELEAELSDSRRLIVLRDQELQALQTQLGATDPALPEPTPLDETPIEAEGVPPDEIIAEDPADAGAGAEEPAEVIPDEIVESEPQAAGPDVVVTTSGPEESSFLGQLFTSVWFYLSLVIAGLLAWLVIRQRTAAEGPADSWDRLDTGVGDFDEIAAATTSLGTPPPEEHAFVVEEELPDEDSDVGDDSPFADIPPDADDVFAADEEEPELPFERTISAESAVNLDQADPIAEADFHMAYGLYDQAADLLTTALESDSERKDLRLKLLEVYFIWENQGGFLNQAQILQDSIDVSTDPDWNKVLIMGKQICPAEELFAAAPAAPAEPGEIDLAFGEEAEIGEGDEIDITFGAADESVDLLFDDDDDGDEMIDFNLTGEELTGDDGGGPTEETPTIEAESTAGSTMESPTIESAMVEGLSNESDSDSTMETPTMENPSVSTTMETPTIESPRVEGLSNESDGEFVEPVEQTAEIDLDDLGLDLAGIDDGEIDGIEADSSADLEASDFGTDFSPLDETGIKPQISGEEASVDLDLDDESDVDDDALKDVLDVEPTAQMPNVDLESFVGDTVEQPTVGDTAEQPSIARGAERIDGGSAAGTRVDLDIDEDIALEDEPGGASGTATAAVVEGATMTEVGTKLDLARAYIDMGDPDGARSILNEVLEEAIDSQRQEAQKLLDDLGD